MPVDGDACDENDTITSGSSGGGIDLTGINVCCGWCGL
jgi:hypothetical protein